MLAVKKVYIKLAGVIEVVLVVVEMHGIGGCGGYEVVVVVVV